MKINEYWHLETSYVIDEVKRIVNSENNKLTSGNVTHSLVKEVYEQDEFHPEDDLNIRLRLKWTSCFSSAPVEVTKLFKCDKSFTPDMDLVKAKIESFFEIIKEKLEVEDKIFNFRD